MANPEYLTTVPDEVTMTREEFMKLLRRFRHHRKVKYGFSKKHTADISDYRKNAGVTSVTPPAGVYDLPVEYNTDVTFVVGIEQ